jgi:nicotinate-nucleotide pyrophosphorylase (carboxylating)
MKETIKLINSALREDKAFHDVTTLSTVPANAVATARLIAKQDGVVSGLSVFAEVFKKLNKKCKVTALVKDSARVKAGQTVATVSGPARAILSGERTALNFISHLSGIASRTAAFVQHTRGTKTQIFDTRKTVPGMRALAKHAVRCGGGSSHRKDLSEMALIKDNHLQIIKDLSATVSHMKQKNADLKIEVECETHAQVLAALQARCDVLMLDNMTPAEMKREIAFITDFCKKNRVARPEIEISGGVSLDTIEKISHMGVDRISVGAITHSAPALDFSLEIEMVK